MEGEKMRLRKLAMTLWPLAIPIGTWAADPRLPTQPHLEHIAVWTADLDKTAAFLGETLGWRRHPLVFGVNEDSTVFGGMKLAFVDTNGFWLELVQPTTEGPGMEFLKQKGKGSLVELDFFVDDFDKSVALLKSKGVEPAGMDGKPMAQGGLLREWAIKRGKKVNGDERLAYLPMNVSRGTSIEVGWEYPSGVVLYRDETWGPNERTPAAAPHIDHVTLAVSDMEKSASIYAYILDLKRMPTTPGLRRDWMGVSEDSQAWFYSYGSVWIDLLGPSGPKGEAILKDSRFGDGAIMELAVEVPSVDAFYDEMKGKGIVMTGGDATPLPPNAKAIATPTGDRYCYFPPDRSEGMRIMVFERAKNGHGALARRDALAAQ
jgi:catechol 2,3-dioxygenase-like lactoylglutathione lyase family enzyme